MSTQRPYTDRPAAERPIQAHKWLGRDAQGYHHHLDRQTEAIHRFHPDGTRERRTWVYAAFDSEDAAALEAAVDRYVHGFVAQEIGWDERVPTHSDAYRDGASAGPLEGVGYGCPLGSYSHAGFHERRSPL